MTVDPLPPVIGHRGACGHAPENTIASIRKAAEYGARWVEFDTKLSRDGHVIVFHDDRVERTTDGTGRVEDLDLAALKVLDAGGWYSKGFRGEPIPTLAEVMAVLAEIDVGGNVEIKSPPGREAETGRAVALALARDWPNELPRPLISSFSLESLAAAAEAAPGIPRALLVLKFPKDWRHQLRELDCQALHCLNRRITPARARALNDAGYAIRAFTVNNRRRGARLFGWGVQGVITNYPERMLPLARYTHRPMA